MKAFIYRNLHFQGHIFSIKALEGLNKNRVVGHAPGILLQNVEFIVSETGRQRVLTQKRKNVHAGIVGNIIAVYQYRPRLPSPLKTQQQWFNQVVGYPINYNPYSGSTFYIVGVNTPIHKAEFVSIQGGDIRVLSKPVNIENSGELNARRGEINRSR